MIRMLGTEFVHFYLLEQDGEVTLIDAGVSGYRDSLEPVLAEMGRSIDDVKAVVLTHADPNHVGFAVRRRRRQQARHRHRKARRAGRSSRSPHVHHRGTNRCPGSRNWRLASCTLATATSPRREPARSSPRPAPNAGQTHPATARSRHGRADQGIT